MDQKTEIRSYIKCRIRLNIDSKQIFNELCGIYGPQTISMRTDFRRVKAFNAPSELFQEMYAMFCKQIIYSSERERLSSLLDSEA